MQYQVPQFIETEDKVVGPFSLRQFAYVGAALLVSAICYFFLQTWLFAIIALILVGGSLALSFVKINGRPLVKVIVSAMNFYWKPQLYVWKPAYPVAQRRAPAAVRALPPMRAARSAETVRDTQAIAQGDSLHRSWEHLQTGTAVAAKEMSAHQFVEKKMAERYQIFQRQGGDRAAARRVDYR